MDLYLLDAGTSRSMGGCTLLLSFFTHPILIVILLITSLIYTYPDINPFINTITGAKIEYNMMDWFTFNSWLPLLLAGIVLGQTIKLSFMENYSILTEIGKNSLNLYTLHYILFSLIYKLI
jgi:fucose 4-O-acetylase-like acetyltransferase